MRIFESIRGHFALLTGHTMKTLSRGAEFSIEKVIATKDTKSDWRIALKLISSGNYVDIYITDILRVYTMVVSKWAIG